MGIEVEYKEVNTKQKVTIYVCDICGAKSKNNRGCCGDLPFDNCDLCKRLVCKEHKYLLYEGGGDYPDGTYCTECWDVGQPFRAEIKRVEELWERTIDEQTDLWKEAGIANRKSKKMDKK